MHAMAFNTWQNHEGGRQMVRSRSSLSPSSACPAADTGPALWNGVSAGMSEAEVRAALPAAQAPFVAEVGAASWLQMAGIALAGEPAVATLHFRQGRLDAVKVAPERRLERACAEDLARKLCIELRQRYGDEIQASTTPDDWGSYARHVWVDGRSKIVLHLHLNCSRQVPLASVWVTYSGAQA
jgi:hypothetical protein